MTGVDIIIGRGDCEKSLRETEMTRSHLMEIPRNDTESNEDAIEKVNKKKRTVLKSF